MEQDLQPGTLGSNAGLGRLAPMEQLLAFCDWERKHRPHPYGAPHVAEWAATEIEKLRVMLARYRDEVPLGHQPHMLAHLVDEALGRA